MNKPKHKYTFNLIDRDDQPQPTTVSANSLADVQVALELLRERLNVPFITAIDQQGREISVGSCVSLIKAKDKRLVSVHQS